MHAVHKESGAKMVPFGGWDMPVEYSGLIAEHQAVRTAAGLFDVSHMGEFEVTGPGALAFLQRVTANDVAKLAVGQAQYSALPMPSGCPVDDVIVYRRGEERYLIVVSTLEHGMLLPTSPGHYVPTVWDWGTFVGTLGFFCFFMLLFLRFVPVISMSELREMVAPAHGAREEGP